jgi:hypothetical protein
MTVLRNLFFVVLAAGMALAQSGAEGGGQSQSSAIADELKALREAVMAQQTQIAEQQQRMAQQQQQIEKLQQTLMERTGTPRVENAALTVSATPATTTTANAVQETEKPKESPLSFRIGGTDFTPGGFVDFENVFRTTNTGNVAATNFWSIPYSNTVNGHLTEYRSTGQYSRFNLKVSGKYGANNVLGYIESDFNGNDAANVFVSSNSHTFRLRVFWVDLKRGKWEFLGGSTWGLQTPNRTGISPMPSDLALTYGEDAQTHIGLNYTRAGEFRVGYHFTDHAVWAFAAQNPQQFIGQGNETIFPAQFNGVLANQFDNATTPGAPNLAPDFITKFAFDPTFAGKHAHLELGALSTSAKIAVIPSVAGATFSHHSKFGGGVFGAFNVEPIKNFRLIGNAMWGNGIGRYLIGMGPQAVIVPIPAGGAGACTAGGAGNCDADISMVHAGDALVGVELQPHPKTQLGVYYGGAYFQRNFFPDLTVAPNAAGLRPNIGFGFPNVIGPTPALSFGGSANSSNRALQEGTFDWTQTFWRNPQYGSVLLVTQTSYITRAPWFVAAGAPKNAHLMQVFVSLRYVIP